MSYSRPPFPRHLYQKFCALSAKLGWSKRGEKWKVLDMALDYMNEHPSLFRKR